MRVIHALAALALCLAAAATADTAVPDHAPKGSLLLIGGAERDNNPLLWPEVLRLCGGPGKRVAIFPTASARPARTGALYAQLFRSMGLDPVVVPLSADSPTPNRKDVAHAARWIKTIDSADAIFLAGGDQARYTQALFEANGDDTPLLAALRGAYRRGALIVGTSAGTAVMSRVMMLDGESMVMVMQQGAQTGRGLGLLPDGWFVDQHFMARGRFGRALVAMQQSGIARGLGIDEDTALLVERGANARVIGYGGVLLMDATHAKRDASVAGFNWSNVRLSFLSHGDRIDLDTLAITVGPGKTDEYRIDPRAPDFDPYYLQPQFATDIFAGNVLRDLMVRLVDSPFDIATGIGFDGAAARLGPSAGFELRFSRTGHTVSWDSPTAAGDPNTVLDMRLDIRPIRVSGPLYR